MPEQTTVFFGGSFNPFGLHHLASVRWLLDQGFEVWVAPSEGHPEKPAFEVDFFDRADMAKQSVSELGDRVKVTPVEHYWSHYVGKGEPSYTYLILHLLKLMYPERKFKFAVGPDCAQNLHTWKFGKEVVREFGCIEIPVLGDHRSTQIRAMIASSQPGWELLVHSEAAKLIKSKGLYGFS